MRSPEIGSFLKRREFFISFPNQLQNFRLRQLSKKLIEENATANLQQVESSSKSTTKQDSSEIRNPDLQQLASPYLKIYFLKKSIQK